MEFQRPDEDTYSWRFELLGWQVGIEWHWGDWCWFYHDLHPGFWIGIWPLYIMAFPNVKS